MDEVKVDPDLYQLQTSKLIGQHNRNNLQAVWEITKQLQRQTDKVRQALLSFKGLPHRLELCFETAQLNCYNDSKATSPNATIEALNAFYNIELLILQGQFKELDYQPLISKAKEKCNTIWLIGGMRELMTSDLSKRQFISYKNLNEAFKNAKLPTSGNILFSPAAPSYGDYQNYEQRGDHFKTFFESS
jgi:UDP-N-acetylmuramoylalanine--D-glutamate ligase